MTVTHLARSCGLSRSTVLYYESIGLLKQVSRTSGNYRAYGERDAARLRQICLFRDSGLKLEDIRALLDGGHSDAAAVLERRLMEIGAEIDRLKSHQHAIVRLLQKRTSFRRNDMVTKDKLVGIMRAAGLTEEDMKRFHQEFEKSAPAEHQEFLEFLHITPDEVKQIREWSRK